MSCDVEVSVKLDVKSSVIRRRVASEFTELSWDESYVFISCFSLILGCLSFLLHIAFKCYVSFSCCVIKIFASVNFHVILFWLLPVQLIPNYWVSSFGFGLLSAVSLHLQEFAITDVQFSSFFFFVVFTQLKIICHQSLNSANLFFLLFCW